MMCNFPKQTIQPASYAEVRSQQGSNFSALSPFFITIYTPITGTFDVYNKRLKHYACLPEETACKCLSLSPYLNDYHISPPSYLAGCSPCLQVWEQTFLPSKWSDNTSYQQVLLKHNPPLTYWPKLQR